MAARKDLFSRALSAAPGRLHMAAHSHHLWPDVTLAAQVEAWEDAAALADHKWDKALGQVYPAAQGLVARELNLPSSETVVFAPNTHLLLATLVSAIERPRPVRVLSTNGEFHSFRRQAQRWVESGEITLTPKKALSEIDALFQLIESAEIPETFLAERDNESGEFREIEPALICR